MAREEPKLKVPQWVFSADLRKLVEEALDFYGAPMGASESKTDTRFKRVCWDANHLRSVLAEKGTQEFEDSLIVAMGEFGFDDEVPALTKKQWSAVLLAVGLAKADIVTEELNARNLERAYRSNEGPLGGMFRANTPMVKQFESRYRGPVQERDKSNRRNVEKPTKRLGTEEVLEDSVWQELCAPKTARIVAEIFRIHCLGPRANQDDRSSLVKFLDVSNHPKVIEDAARCLWDVGVSAEDALPALRGLLYHANEHVQAAAIEELGRYGGGSEIVAELVAVGRRDSQSPLIVERVVNTLSRLEQPGEDAVRFLGDVALPKRATKDEVWQRVRHAAETGVRFLTEPPEAPRTPLDHISVIQSLRMVSAETTRADLQVILNDLATYFREHRLDDITLNRQLCKEVNAALRKTNTRIACYRCKKAGPSVLYCQPSPGIPHGQFKFQHRMPDGEYSLHGGTVLLPDLNVVIAPQDRRKTKTHKR